MLKIDTEFLQPFVDETIRTLKDQCNFDADPSPPFIKGKEKQTPFDIIGIIGITSSRIKGNVSLCFQKSVFLELMSNMTGEKHVEVSRELEDGAAELLNIIFANARITLNESGHDFQMAIPTVLKGTNVSSGYVTGGVVIVMPFKTKMGDFYIEFLTVDTGETTAKPRSANAPRRKIDAMIFQPFVNETIKTLKTVGGFEVMPGIPYYKKDKPDKTFDIAGVVGITSPILQGSFTLCFPKNVFLKVISYMVGEPCTELTREIEDGAAELVNIVFGNAKKFLNEEGYAISMAIPTIIKGDSILSNYYSKSPVIVLPFTNDEGEFWIEFTYE